MLHVIVADSKVVRVLALDPDDALIEIATLANRAAASHERDFVADRAGRAINAAAGTRVTFEPKASARTQSLQRWIKTVGGELKTLLAARHHEGLVIVASARLLPLLRTALPAELKRTVLAEISRDLAKQPLAALQKHLQPTLRAAVKEARHASTAYQAPRFRAGD